MYFKSQRKIARASELAGAYPNTPRKVLKLIFDFSPQTNQADKSATKKKDRSGTGTAVRSLTWSTPVKLVNEISVTSRSPLKDKISIADPVPNSRPRNPTLVGYVVPGAPKISSVALNRASLTMIPKIRVWKCEGAAYANRIAGRSHRIEMKKIAPDGCTLGNSIGYRYYSERDRCPRY